MNTDPDSPLAAAIDQLCAPWTRDGSPGCVVTVTQGDEVLHCRGYGLADVERRVPLSPATAFDVGSLAKQITAACILFLADEGRLRLDDEARRHVPGLPAGITIDHLVHHTSGVRDYLELLAFAGRRHLPLPAPPQLLRLLLRQRDLNFAPGSQFRYSNSGYVLLAAVVDSAAGMPLADYARTAIFEPLGMTSTWFAADGQPAAAGLTPAYGPAAGGSFTAAPPLDLAGSDPVGDGGLRTTAEDASRWERNVHHNRLARGGPRLLRRLAKTARIAAGPSPYAFGLVPGRLGRHAMLYHGGTAGAYRSGLVRLPRQRLSVVCMANLATLDAVDLARQVAALCLDTADAPLRSKTARPARRISPAAADAPPAALAGLYRSAGNGRIWRLAFADGDGGLRAESGPLQVSLAPAGRRRLRGTGLVAFDLTWKPDAAGRVERLTVLADGEAPATLTRVEPVVPSAAELAGYAGAYLSEELEAAHQVRAAQGHLELVMQGLPFGMPLAPLRRDEFTTQGVILQFQRDAAGHVEGFAASSPGVTALRFVRPPRGIAAALERQAARFLLTEEFRTIGAPGLLSTNESTAADFYPAIRAAVQLDGYLFGVGCGNVVALTEAFPDGPRGIVLVDVDPLVVFAGRMLVAAIARHPTVEAFVGEFFRGGRAALEELERQVLAAAEPALRVRLESHRDRLWRAFTILTENFAQGAAAGPAAADGPTPAPADAATLLAQWATHWPPRGEMVPVWAILARNYPHFHALARRGDVAVLCSSIFHPELLAAIAALPDFATSRNLIYLSNVVDHLLRRALLAEGRRRLGLQGDDEAPAVEIRSTAEFADQIERDQMAPLRRFGGAVCVDATARHRLALRWHLGVPRYTAADLSVDIDIDALTLRFFASLAGPASAVADQVGQVGQVGQVDEMAAHRAVALRLYSSVVTGDELPVRHGLRQLGDVALAAAAAAENDPDDLDAFLAAAFLAAELGHLALMTRRIRTAWQAGLADLAHRWQPLAGFLAAGAARRRPRPLDGIAALLVAQACEVAGALLAAPTPSPEVDALLDRAGLESLPTSLALLAEAAVRLLFLDLHGPHRPAVQAATTRAITALLRAIEPNGRLADPATADGGATQASYGAYLLRPETLYQNARLALILYGLKAYEAAAIGGALRIDHFASHHGVAPTPETDVLLGTRG